MRGLGRERDRTVSSNPPLYAINLGSLLSSSPDQPQNPQQTETFRVNDRTGDYRRDGNLRSESTFFSKASYFPLLVHFSKPNRDVNNFRCSLLSARISLLRHTV